jgi:hypothetical protein
VGILAGVEAAGVLDVTGELDSTGAGEAVTGVFVLDGGTIGEATVEAAGTAPLGVELGTGAPDAPPRARIRAAAASAATIIIACVFPFLILAMIYLMSLVSILLLADRGA